MPSIVGWLECRLYSDKAVRFPVCVTPFRGGSPRKEGTPECKQHSRRTWPLLTRIGWTPHDRGGQRPWNIIAAAHRVSFSTPSEKCFFAKELFCFAVANRFERVFAKRKKKQWQHWETREWPWHGTILFFRSTKACFSGFQIKTAKYTAQSYGESGQTHYEHHIKWIQDVVIL